MEDELAISILTTGGPGNTPENAMALVRLSFHQKVKAKCARIHSDSDEFLSMEVGEVLNIEGPARKWSWFQEVYDAVNAIGSKGLVFQANVDFIAC